MSYRPEDKAESQAMMASESHGRSARTTTAIRFPPDVHDRLKDAAEERDLSMNFLVVRAVSEFLGRLLPVEEIQWTTD